MAKLLIFIIFICINVVKSLIHHDGRGSEAHKNVTVDEIPIAPPFNVGFGGVWDARVSSMYFVDHYTNSCYRYSLIEKKVFKAEVETNFTISFIFPLQETAKNFLVGAGNTIILVQWDGIANTAKLIKFVCEVEPYTGNIMNHAVAGRRGELIFGTYHPMLCSANATQGLYQRNGSEVVALLTDVIITSGVAIDEKLNSLYHMDGCKGELRVFDRNDNTGELTNERVVIKFDFPATVLLVGLVIDTRGCLYSGLYGGSALIKIYPTTKTYRLIEMPTPFIGDPGFGGCNNDIFFVATGTAIPDFLTAKLNKTIDTQFAGSVLKVNGLGVKGRPARLPSAKDVGKSVKRNVQ